MGIVYEAWDPLLERTVALKTIQLAFTTSPEETALYEQRFFAEARIAARLAHPGVVVVHDVGQSPETGTLYIAFECLEGQTLAEVLRSGTPLPWSEALRVTARIAEALHYAHAQGVVHRDLKPANVMVLPTGEPKILDFGIARTDTARIKLTITGQSVGTPLYASPEQTLGQPVDSRGDLFSLGAIAYALLTGRAAFAAETITGVIRRVIDEDPEPPSSLVPGLPPEVDRIIARALAKDPADRYPDGLSLASDVADVLAGGQPRNAGTPPHHHARWDAAADLDAQFAALVAPGAHAAHGAGAETMPPADASAGPSSPAGAELTPSAISRGPRRLVVALVGFASLLLFSFWLWHARSPRHAARAPEVPAALAPRVSPTPARQESGWLAIETDLPRNSRLSVWVDRVLVVDRMQSEGAAPPRPIAVASGGHDIEVQLTRDGKRSTERVRGDFRSGATRRLRARFGGLLRKKLTLEWE
jgi:hypothetical protein